MHRRRYLAMSALLVLIAVGAVFVWRWEHRGPSAPSVSDAIGRFRTSTTRGPAITEPLVPRAGVYLYDGTGRESLSFLATWQSQGPTEPGTVVRQSNGCWQFRIDFNSFHSQTWSRCADGRRLTESGGTTNQKFDFATFKVGEHSEITCDPPFVVADLGARPGTTWPVHCTGRSRATKSMFVQAGDATLVGRELVVVGGKAVPALHTREAMVLSGDQTGEVRVDIWLAASDGLPLKEVHSIRVVSPAPPPLGHVTYTERGTWQLASTTPRT
jgi:hypothetical protein